MNWIISLGLSFAMALPTVGSAQPASVDITAYNQKGEMGKISLQAADAFHLESSTALNWNNRRYRLNEKVILDASGYPVSIEITGTSAFGAPIEEHFERLDGTSAWRSLKETGASSADGFYVPADMGLASRTALLRAILASKSGGVDLLPSGRATAQKVATREIYHGEAASTVSLYAFEGLDLMPEYYWFDDNLLPVGFGEPTWGGLSSSYDKGQLTALAKARDAAERDHLHKMAEALGNDYTSVLITNVRVVDVEQGLALEQQDVLLQNGVIEAVQAHPSKLSAEKRVDGSGSTLIPGLWDMHGHLDTYLGPLYIASGVTSVRDIGSAHDRIMRVEANFNDGKVIGPNVYRSGFMDRFTEYSSGLSVKSLEEAHETSSTVPLNLSGCLHWCSMRILAVCVSADTYPLL